MIIIKNEKDNEEGKWFDFNVFGQPVRLKIRPRYESVIKSIRARHKKTKNNVPVFDEEKILDELADYMLEDFEGFGDESGKPLDVNLPNKKKIVFLQLQPGEMPIFQFIVEKSIELAVEVRNAEVKNS